MLQLMSRGESPWRFVASLSASLVLAAATVAGQPAHALSVDFESLLHGQVANGTLGSTGLEIDASNPNRGFDLAVAFDTNLSGTADLDLEYGGGWNAGNIAGEQLGIILILQESDTGCASGICASPDDEGSRPAGDLILSFDTPLLDFGLDLVDVESATTENGSIVFFDGASSATVTLSDFVNAASSFYDPTITFGNNSANRIAAITAAELGLEQIDAVTVSLGGSGGIDNLTGTVIPEPTTALMMLLGLAGLAYGSERRPAASRHETA